MTEHHPTPETEKSPAFPWLEWTSIREHLATLTERVAGLTTRIARMEGELKDLREEIKTVKALQIGILFAIIAASGGIIAALLMK